MAGFRPARSGAAASAQTRLLPEGHVRMHLHLDTADRAAAEPLLATGLFASLTTVAEELFTEELTLAASQAFGEAVVGTTR